MKNAPVFALLLALGVAGCAGSVHAPVAVAPVDPANSVKTFTAVSVTIVPGPGVAITDVQSGQLRDIVQQRLVADYPNLGGSPTDANGHPLRVEIDLTRYNRGSGVARAMLMGLGQMHIDGGVTLYSGADTTPIGKFTVKKTFAGGGIYGASTTMKDVEGGFAASVSAIFKEKKPAKA